MTNAPDDDTPAGTPCAGARCDNQLREHELRARISLCGRCGRDMAAWMRDIPRQMAHLRAMRERERSGGGGRTGTRTAPLPGSEHVLNLLGPAAPIGWVEGIDDDQYGPLPIHETLYRAMTTVRRARGMAGPEGNTEEALAGWLVPHMEWAATQRWGPQVHGTLHAMMGTIWATTRLKIKRFAVSRPCPRCQTLTMQGKDHDDKIECTVCGNLYTKAELCHDAPMTLARLQREWAEDEEAQEEPAVA